MNFYTSEIRSSFWFYAKLYFKARGNSVVLGWKLFPEKNGEKKVLEENDNPVGKKSGLSNEHYKELYLKKIPSGDN